MIRRTACLIARGSDPMRNQAIEKHLMDTLPEDTAILYLWQNAPAVMLGRAQNPWYECPVDDFCAIAQSRGFAVTTGELFTSGMTESDAKLRSVNGGGVNPIDGWDDAYEQFLTTLEWTT